MRFYPLLHWARYKGLNCSLGVYRGWELSRLQWDWWTIWWWSGQSPPWPLPSALFGILQGLAIFCLFKKFYLFRRSKRSPFDRRSAVVLFFDGLPPQLLVRCWAGSPLGLQSRIFLLEVDFCLITEISSNLHQFSQSDRFPLCTLPEMDFTYRWLGLFSIQGNLCCLECC